MSIMDTEKIVNMLKSLNDEELNKLKEVLNSINFEKMYNEINGIKKELANWREDCKNEIEN